MHVHLIAPARIEPLGLKGKASVAPPMALAILAGLSPADVEISLTDENVSSLDWDTPADLVGISSTTRTAPRAYEIADGYRSRGIKVVLGGMHVSALPEEAAAHADAVVVGEAEGLWPQVLADAQAGRLQPLYQAREYPTLAALPLPRRDLFQRERYAIADTLYTTRGCPYGCSFCSVTTFFGGRYRSRPVEDVVAEVEAMGRPGLVGFLDDNIAANPRRAKSLFRALAPYNMSWLGQADLTIARDEELLATLAASGCKMLLIGIETLSATNLDTVGKRPNSPDKYEEAIRRIHAHGIGVFGAFLLGLDDDGEDVFERTLQFARRVHLEGAQFNIPTPYPGTPLYEEMEREGRITNRNWADYSCDQVVFEPRRLSARRLQEGHDWVWREFYSLDSTWERIGLSHPDLLLMWLINLNYRDDWIAHLVLRPLMAVAERVYRVSNGSPTPAADAALRPRGEAQ